MRTIRVRFLLALLSVILPMLVVGLLFGWERRAGEAESLTFDFYFPISGRFLLACLVPIVGVLAFLAGYHLAKPEMEAVPQPLLARSASRSPATMPEANPAPGHSR